MRNAFITAIAPYLVTWTVSAQQQAGQPLDGLTIAERQALTMAGAPRRFISGQRRAGVP